MTSRDFCYWLQGYFEVGGNLQGGLSATQAEMVRKHLNMVFLHEIDPSMGDSEHQSKLNNAHLGPQGEGNILVRC